MKELGATKIKLYAYDNNGNEITFEIAEPNKKFKNQKGKMVFVNKDLSTKHNDSKVKQEAVTLIDELTTTANFDKEKSAKYPHGWVDNNGTNKWEYWTVYLQDENNKIWRATLNISNSTTGNKILYDIDPIVDMKKVGRSVKSDTSTTDNNYTDSPNARQEEISENGKISYSDRDLERVAELERLNNEIKAENEMLKADVDKLKLNDTPFLASHSSLPPILFPFLNSFFWLFRQFDIF